MTFEHTDSIEPSACEAKAFDYHRLPANHIDAISECVIQVDLSGNIQFANDRLQQLSGYSYKELIGRNSNKFLDGKSAIILKKVLMQRKRGVSSSYELRLRCKNGNYHQFIVKGTPVLNKYREVAGSIATLTDVSTTGFLSDYYKRENEAMVEISGSIQLAFWIYSIENKKIEYLSPSFATLYEADIREIYKRNSIKQFIHPEDYDKTIIKGKDNLYSGQYNIQYRIITPNEKIKWIQDSAIIIKDAKGKAVKIIGFAQDVTKMKRAEVKLFEGEKEREAILRSMPDSLFIINNDSIITKAYLKKQDKDLLRVKVKFPEEKHIQQVFSEPVFNVIEPIITEFRKKKMSSFCGDVELMFRNNSRWYELKLNTVDDKKIVLVMKDVTTAKANILRIQRLFNIAERTKELVVITNNLGQIEYVNPEFTEVTGYSSEESVGHTFDLIRSGKHKPAFYEKIWSVLFSKKSYEGVFINKKKNGELFVEEKVITPIMDVNGDIVNFISSGRDITKNCVDSRNKITLRTNRKQRTLKVDHKGSISLIQKQEIERKNFANKLHEGLGQVLSAALMNLESINFDKISNEKDRHKIYVVNQLLGNTIGQLRGLSSDLSPSGLDKFGLYNIANQMVDTLNKQGANIRFAILSNISKLRFKNEIEINYYRILQEALSNAVVHSKATRCDVKLQYTDKGELKLQVMDNGVGISQKQLKENKKMKLGFLNMEERAKSINAQMRVTAGVGKGFKISIQTKTKNKK
jgi:PAS domain S-box-containing protein